MCLSSFAGMKESATSGYYILTYDYILYFWSFFFFFKLNWTLNLNLADLIASHILTHLGHSIR